MKKPKQILRDVVEDLSKQTEMEVRDERLPVDPEGILAWLRELTKQDNK